MTDEFVNFETDLKTLVSELYSIDDTTGVMATVLQAIGAQMDSLKQLIDEFTTIFDIDVCEAKYLPYLAHELGWDLDTNLTEAHQRKIVKLLMAIYREKGTKQGIISLIYLMLRIQVIVLDINDYWVGWRICIDGGALNYRIGINTYIGIGFQDPYMYTFFVNSPRLLTNSERRAIDTLVKFCKPVHTHHVICAPGDKYHMYPALPV